MEILVKIFEFLDSDMETPQPYGWFHLAWFAVSVILAVFLCVTHKENSDKRLRRIVFGVALTLFIMEIYKQIVYSFSVSDGVLVFDYQWYIFPFQFCSVPIYIGLLTGVFKKGKVHEALCAFLATYALFAGVCVMLYPVTVFTSTIGVNIQTMFCHGSMITIGIYLLGSGYIKLRHKTVLGAMSVFAISMACAIIMNELAYVGGITETETFNMFFISPHCDPSLPVYSIVQEHVPYPFCMIIYYVAFSLAAYVILLIAMGIKKARSKNK